MRRLHWCAFSLSIGFVLSGIAWAASKSDFEQAARSSGCNLIPYASEQGSCREHYAKQREWCSGDRERGCGDLKKEDPKDRETAKERRENAKECVEKRKYVRSIYANVVDRLKGESEPEIKPLAQQIISKIEDGRGAHEDAIRDAERRRDKCDDVYNGR